MGLKIDEILDAEMLMECF